MTIQTPLDHYVNAGSIRTRYWHLGNEMAIILY